MPEFKLPDVGEGLTEAEIVTWKVKVGDVITVNDIVVEIETAKSLVELPSPYAGTVTGLLVARGRDGRRSARRSSRSATASTRRPRRHRTTPTGMARRARRPAGAGRDRPVQPRRERWRRGREPGRPQQGRARVAAPAAQGVGRCRRGAALDPRAAGGVVRPRRAGPPRGRRGRRAGRAGLHARAEPRPSCRAPTATSACSPSRRSASSPRTSASTSPSLDRLRRGRRGHPRGRPGRARAPAVSATAAPGGAFLDHAAGRRREPIKGVRKMMGAGDGRLGVHRAARHRVGHRRRDPRRWSSSSGSRRAASSAT